MLRREKSERVVRLILESPPVNVLDIQLLEELTAALDELAQDGSTAAVLLSGEGKCFSAGASVAEHKRPMAPRMIETFERACTVLSRMPFPTGALVHGSCLGGAMELVSACDFVVADPSATFGQPEVRLAFFPPVACRVLPRLVGYQNAAYLALTGEALDAARAASMGLVQEILPRADWDKVAQRFNRLSVPALRLTKRALAIGAGAGDEKESAALREMFLGDLYRIEDVEEGIASFEGKRKPEWKHR
jgi:cyclohexa-1,5-dienecarbonyl-CoA hydratase